MNPEAPPLGVSTPDTSQYEGTILVSAARWGISPAILATEIRSLVSLGTSPVLTHETIDSIAQNLGQAPASDDQSVSFPDSDVLVVNGEQVAPVWADAKPHPDVYKRVALFVVALLIIGVGLWFVLPPHRRD